MSTHMTTSAITATGDNVCLHSMQARLLSMDELQKHTVPSRIQNRSYQELHNNAVNHQTAETDSVSNSLVPIVDTYSARTTVNEVHVNDEQAKTTLHGQSTHYLDFSLNAAKALNKKRDACHRTHVEVCTTDHVNFTINLSTAAFELFRAAIHNVTHTLRDDKAPGGRPSRNVKHITNRDENNLLVSESIEVKNWSAISKATLSGLTGNCRIIIHLYITTSRCLINGAQAKDFICLFLPMMREHFIKNSEDYDLRNMQIQCAIDQLKIKDNKTKKPTKNKKNVKGAPSPSIRPLRLLLGNTDSNNTTLPLKNDDHQAQPISNALVLAHVTDGEHQPKAGQQDTVQQDTVSLPPAMNCSMGTPDGATANDNLPLTLATSPTTNATNSPCNGNTTSPKSMPLTNPMLPICNACKYRVDIFSTICDICHQWFHHSCENLSPDDVAYIESSQSYCCRSCTITSSICIPPRQHQTPIPTHQTPSRMPVSPLPTLQGTTRPVTRNLPAIGTTLASTEHRLPCTRSGSQERTQNRKQNAMHSSPRTAQERQRAARQEEKEQKLDDREKAIKAKEKSLSKLEQTLKRQQLAQTEISLQNAGLVAQVAKLEEKIKSQQGEIHDLSIRLLSGNRPDSPPNAQHVHNTTPSHDTSTLTTIMSLLIPLLMAQPRSDQLLQPVNALSTAVACLTNSVNNLAGRISHMEESQMDLHPNVHPHVNQGRAPHGRYETSRGTRRFRARHYSYHDSQLPSKPRTVDYHHGLQPHRPQPHTTYEPADDVCTPQSPHPQCNPESDKSPTQSARTLNVPPRPSQGTATGSRSNQLNLMPGLQAKRTTMVLSPTAVFKTPPTTAPPTDDPIDESRTIPSPRDSRPHHEELHFLEDICLTAKPPPLELDLST